MDCGAGMAGCVAKGADCGANAWVGSAASSSMGKKSMVLHRKLAHSLPGGGDLCATEVMAEFIATHYLYDLTTRNPKLLKRSAGSHL